MSGPRVPLRILIVEDEALLAMDLQMMIEDAGHAVVGEASCLREVADLNTDLKPHIALVDLQLAEGSSGIDVCAHVRAQWADAVIVFVTANPKKLPGDYAGAHGVIAKPFSRTGLTSALRYLEEGICDPPPSAPSPISFIAAPGLDKKWVL